MADWGVIAEALANTQKQDLATNPYSLMGTALLKTELPQEKPWKDVFGRTHYPDYEKQMYLELGKSLLGGLGAGIGTHQTKRDYNQRNVDLAAALAEPDADTRRQMIAGNELLQPLAGSVGLYEQGIANDMQALRERAGLYSRSVDDPVAQGAIAKGLMGQELTEEEATALSRQPVGAINAYRGMQSQKGIQGRHEDNFDYKQGKSDVGPFKRINEDVPLIKAENAKKLETQWSVLDDVVRLTDEMAKDSSFALTGEEAIANRVYNDVLKNTFRLATGSGAHFTEMEMKLIDGTIIPTLSAGRTLDTVIAAATGRDKQIIADTIKKALVVGFDVKMGALGHVRPDSALPTDHKVTMLNRFGPITTQVQPKMEYRNHEGSIWQRPRGSGQQWTEVEK